MIADGAAGPVPTTGVRVGRFVRHGEPVEDLEQVAAIGLLKALDHFRLPPGYDPVTAFMGYAVPTVSGELLRYLRDHTWVVHVPRPVKEIQGRLWTAVAEFNRQHGRSPRPAELAAGLQVDEALVVEALQAGSARRPTSADAAADASASARELSGSRATSSRSSPCRSASTAWSGGPPGGGA